MAKHCLHGTLSPERDSRRVEQTIGEKTRDYDMSNPLFQKIDYFMFNVENPNAALSFHRDSPLAWRRETSLALQTGKSELVLGKRKPRESEINIKIGKCVVVANSCGNGLALLDSTRGLLKTDKDGLAIARERHIKQMQASVEQ